MELDCVLIEFMFGLLLLLEAEARETRVHLVEHEAVGFGHGVQHALLHCLLL